MPVGFSHLLLQAVHGGCEPHVQKDGRIDISGFGMGRGLIEKTGQIPKIRHEHADGSLVKRDGHVSISPAGTALVSGLNPTPSLTRCHLFIAFSSEVDTGRVKKTRQASVQNR
jgi:hypothetical protein